MRAKIFGNSVKPRLAIFRSNKFIYAQVINDEKGVTLLSASSRSLKKEDSRRTKTEQAYIVGKALAEKCLKEGIKKTVVDRRSYRYHGRVSSLAKGVKEGGVQV